MQRLVLCVFVLRRAWLDWQQSYNFLWVVDWPMFEWSRRRRPLYVLLTIHLHSLAETEHELEGDLSKEVRAIAYDISAQWLWIGWRSLRINHKDLQERMLRHLDLQKSCQWTIWFLVWEAMDYGFHPSRRIGDWFGPHSDASCRWRIFEEVVPFLRITRRQISQTQINYCLVSEKQLDDYKSSK